MGQYIATAVGAIFLTVIIGFIIPEGKLNKVINFVMRLICIFVLIQPVTSLFDFSEDQAAIVDYDYICTVYSDNQSDLLENVIYENFGLESECTVDIEYTEGQFTVGGVTVILGDIVDCGTKLEIYEYLEDLGYIDINVNEKTA